MSVFIRPALLPLFVIACACDSRPIAAPTAAPGASAPASVPAAPPSSVERLTADSPRKTNGGTVFTAPAGWSIRTSGSLIVLEPPESDSHVAIVDAQAAGSADAAVAAAWTAYRPGRKRSLKLAMSRPARKGWDERRQYDYLTSPNERLVVQAIARRQGKSWTVLLIEASEATFDRRLGQMILLTESLRPKDYVRESFAGKKAQPLDAQRIKKLGEFIELGRKALGIPGVSIGLFDGNREVFVGGFGVRELGKAQRVDADTLFMAASNTKALTTLLLAKLVDEGKLAWDMPVAKAYPRFKLGDADTTRRVLIKHLVCACTGLPRQDLEALFEFERATALSSIELLGTMQPTTQFGELFQYSNLLAAAAGYVGAYTLDTRRELGAAYDDAMRTRIFAPLQMRSTTFDFAQAERQNHARPHADDIDGKPGVVPMALNRSLLPIRPAGGAWTSARDLLRYIALELRRGKLADGRPLLSEANLLARRQKQVAVGEDTSYGMGLMMDSSWGIPVVSHGGSVLGYKSDMLFLPEHGVGAVILTNAESGSYLTTAFARRLVELLFDGHSEAVEDLLAQAEEKSARIKKDRERLAVPAAPAATKKLAANYVSSALGSLAVKQQDGATILDFGGWQSAVGSRTNDDGTLSLITLLTGSDGFEFVVGESAGKRTLTIRDAQHEYVFTEA